MVEQIDIATHQLSLDSTRHMETAEAVGQILGHDLPQMNKLAGTQPKIMRQQLTQWLLIGNLKTSQYEALQALSDTILTRSWTCAFTLTDAAMSLGTSLRPAANRSAVLRFGEVRASVISQDSDYLLIAHTSVEHYLRQYLRI